MGKRFSVTKEQNIDDIAPSSKFNANQSSAADDSQLSSGLESGQRKTSGVGLKLYTNRIPSEAVMQKMEKDLTRLNLLSSNAASATTGTPLVSATIQSRMKDDSASGAGSSRRRQETDSGYLSKDTNKSEFDPSTIDKEEKTKDLFSSGNEQVKSAGSNITGATTGPSISTCTGYSKSSKTPYTPTYISKLSGGGASSVSADLVSPSSVNPPFASSPISSAAVISGHQHQSSQFLNHQNQNLGQWVGESITSSGATAGAATTTTTVVNYNISLSGSTNNGDCKRLGYTNHHQTVTATPAVAANIRDVKNKRIFRGLSFPCEIYIMIFLKKRVRRL